MSVAETRIEIEAPLALVWETMLDVGKYLEWNPFIVRIDCDAARPQVGSDLTLHVRFQDGQQVATHERVSKLEEPHADKHPQKALLEYEFLGPLHTLYLVRGKRQQDLEALSGTRTRYHTYERLHGLLAFAAPIAKVQDGFERHAAALKARCEALAAAARKAS